MRRPEWLNDDLWEAMRCPLTRRRFLSLMGVAGLGAYVSVHDWTVPDTFYVRSVESPEPTFDPHAYRLVVDGLVRRPLSFTYRTLFLLSPVREACHFQCIEGWTVDNVPWEGVQLRTIMTLTRPLASARFVTFHCLDGTYTESLTLEQAQMPQAMLAYCMYSHPLPPEHGSPLRLVVPGMLGYKSAKWVTRVEFRDGRDRGYWEQLGAPLGPLLRDEEPCLVRRSFGCPSCRREATRGLLGLRDVVPTPAQAPLTADTTQAGPGCGTQP